MRTIGELLHRQASERGRAPFVVHSGHEFSYSEVDLLARSAAAGFAGAGVKRGDRVCLALPNGMDILIGWLGLACLGAIEVPINLEFKSHQVKYVLEDAGATMLVAESKFFRDHREVILQCQSLTTVVLVDDPSGVDPGRLELASFAKLRSASPAEPGAFSVKGSDPMAILYTSGTTGMPKGVLLCHEHEATIGGNIAESFRLHESDRFYNFFPMHHNTAQGIITCSVLYAGASMLLIDRFSKSRFWADVRDHRCTVFYGMGAILEILNKDPDGPVASRGHTLRAGWGIAMGAEQVEKFTSLFGVQFITGYGSTEANMPTMTRLGEVKEGLAGKILPDFEVAIVDEYDRPRAPGELGEIVVRAKRPYITFLEYWGKPKETVQAWRNLWFHSGDAGFLDESGQLFFVDRVKDVIRHRGNNVSSVEVEGVLLELPAVQEVAVVAAPSEMGVYEQEVRAIVVLAEGHAWNPEAIIAHCAEKLPYYAVPRFLDRAAELPKTPTAKVKKNELRAQGLLTGTWDRIAAGIKLQSAHHGRDKT
jgi:crotonobetaine/carnitine-CoA ligase